jgi:hypothetical protein
MEGTAMTNHVARLYALAISLVVFFAVWLAVSAHPWSQPSAATAAGDAQTARLKAREGHLRAETRRVNLIVNRRYAHYRKALAHRNRVNAAARARHRHQVSAARNAIAARNAVSASQSRSYAAAPPPVRIVTLPAVASTRTS